MDSANKGKTLSHLPEAEHAKMSESIEITLGTTPCRWIASNTTKARSGCLPFSQVLTRAF